MKSTQTLKTKFKKQTKQNYITRLENAIFTSTHTGVNGIQVFKVPQRDKASLPVPSNLGQGRQRSHSSRGGGVVRVVLPLQRRKTEVL